MVNQSIGGGRMNGNEFWITLLRRVPGNLHDSLCLGLTSGAEIVTQRLIKLDSEFMVTRGRLAGTTDPGRIIMIPYAQLTHVSVMRELSEAEMDAIFGQGDAPPAAIPDAASAAAAPELATVNDAPAGVNAPKKMDAPSKTILLAKLRDRLKDSPAKK